MGFVGEGFVGEGFHYTENKQDLRQDKPIGEESTSRSRFIGTCGACNRMHFFKVVIITINFIYFFFVTVISSVFEIFVFLFDSFFNSILRI